MILKFNPHAMDGDDFEAHWVWYAARPDAIYRYSTVELEPKGPTVITLLKSHIEHYRDELKRLSEGKASRKLMRLVADLEVCNEVLIISYTHSMVVATDTSGEEFHELESKLHELTEAHRIYSLKLEEFSDLANRRKRPTKVRS